jgi:hypothetical protein
MKLSIPMWIPADSGAKPPVPWPRTLSGKTMALLDNSKDGAATVLERVGRAVIGDAKDVKVIRLRKPSAGIPMSPAVVDTIKSVDAVVTGLAD